MNIEPLHHSDLNKVLDLQPEGWDILAFHEFYTSHNYCLPTKVVVDGNMVGIGTTILHNDVAWLAHIIVHDNYRNQGIGKLITENLVEVAHAKKCATIYLLATELGEPVYRKIGFEAETDYLMFKGEKIKEAVTDFEKIIPYRSDFKNQITSMDRHVSGEDRMFHLEPHLSSGFVYLQDNIVAGYYLPTFGDGLIIANMKTAGQELMKFRLTTKDNAAFPGDNLHAAEIMRQYNFKEVRIQKRMRLGKKRDWQPQDLYNRIGGNLG